MRTVVVLTGARGAGKSTAVDAVEAQGLAKKLKPFTTRERRTPQDDEYHFVDRKPNKDNIAWIIPVGDHSYGMLKREIEAIEPGQVGLTVFEPTQLDVLKRYRDEQPGVEVVIIGLDTILDPAEQAERVGNDPKRLEDDKRITQIRDIVQRADMVLTGDAQTVADAVAATCRLLAGRGGMVAKRELLPLINAGCLLRGATPENVESASYDLRLGDEVWCQGQFTTLTTQSPVFEIPAYSYAIVKAGETAALPSFFAGQFDIRVGHFLTGVVLSNGPQVDPGYWGELFCMLFNGSSSSKAIKLGDHFATLHFWTTTRTSDAYSGFYRMREKLANQMKPEAITGLGGRIDKVVDQKVEAMASNLRKEMPKDHATSVFGTTAIMATIVIGLAIWAATTVNDAKSAISDVKAALRELEAARETTAKENATGAPVQPVVPAAPVADPTPATDANADGAPKGQDQ